MRRRRDEDGFRLEREGPVPYVPDDDPAPPRDRERDDYENALVATGGVFAALHSSGLPGLRGVSMITDANGNATNRLRVYLTFMRSPYILTIEREHEHP